LAILCFVLAATTAIPYHCYFDLLSALVPIPIILEYFSFELLQESPFAFGLHLDHDKKRRG
jgi:hypothetical protein